ncbi:MAG: septum formation inhibitor Maf [Proteobacteria bacterium]|nr:septum formation inhibitor Maf [Pseudomonadota bacterium]
MNFPEIYLASKSPRRRELLTQIAVKFSVLPADVDESRLSGESPKDYVRRVAIAKAQAGWDSLADADKKPVLGSDTSVILENTVLGKPIDEQNAKQMLQQLSGRNHQVMTAVAVVSNNGVQCELSISNVTFAVLSDADIAWYIATKEGTDKAGGYAVQGLAAVFIDKIEGSYSAIMGLPLREMSLMLMQLAGQDNE